MPKVRHPELVLAGAVAVCLPMVPGFLSGQITPISAAERFLIALVVCWVLGALLSWVFTTYSAEARKSELRRLIEADRDPAGSSSGPAPAE